MARIIVSMRDKALYGRTWPAQAEEVKTMLGLKPGQPLPREGMAERLIQGIRVYVAPLLPGWGKRHNGGWQGLRVMAICDCGRHVTVSRLQQHKCEVPERDEHCISCETAVALPGTDWCQVCTWLAEGEVRARLPLGMPGLRSRRVKTGGLRASFSLPKESA